MGMIGKRLVAIFIGLILLVMAAPTAMAHEDGLFAILICEEGTFGSGEAPRIEVHTFDKGERVDVDLPPSVMFQSGPSDDGREIYTTKADTGVYKGQINLIDSDLVGSPYGYAYFHDSVDISEDRSVFMTRSWSGEEDEQYDYLHDGDYMDSAMIKLEMTELEQKGINIDYEYTDPSGYPWGPGESVEFRVFVTEDALPIDPENLTITYDDGSHDIIDVPYNNVSRGVYDAFLTIPTDLKHSTSFEVEIEVEIEVETEADREWLYFGLEIDFYQVWFHDISTDMNDRTFELHVADMEGIPVPGAEIFFESFSDGYIHDRKIADGEGKVEFTITEVTEDLYLEGWVEKDGLNQTFEGDIYHVQDEEGPDPGYYVPEPYGRGFQVTTLDQSFDMDEKKITHQYWGFLDREPIEKGAIYYYAHNENEVLGFGKAMTNDTGVFSITFDTPTNSGRVVSLDFETDVGYHPAPFVGFGWVDTDTDGFSDAFEQEVGTDHLSMFDYPADLHDTDGDGFTDGFEKHEGTDPEDGKDFPHGYIDSDGDQYGDLYEEYLGTDPYDDEDHPLMMFDTDEDGYGDDFESYYGTDPEDYFDYPEGLEDSDGDGKVDGEEMFYGTDPEDDEEYPTDVNTRNSDGDSLYLGFNTYDQQFDAEELFYGTDPEDEADYPYDRYSVDSDYDGFPDLEEIYFGADPEDMWDYPVDPYEKDSDRDGICDPEEEFYGTDPFDINNAPDREPSAWDSRYSDHNSTDGRMYEHTQEYLYGYGYALDSFMSDSLYAEVRDFKVGGMNTLKVSIGYDVNKMGFGVFFVGDMDDLSSSLYVGGNMEWEAWAGSDTFLLFENADGDYEGFFNIPEFLPSGGQEYTIIGGFDGGMINYVVIKDGGSASTEGSLDEDGSFLESSGAIAAACGLGLFLLVVIVLVMLFVVSRKRKEKERGKGPKDVQKANIRGANQGEITGGIADDLELSVALTGVQTPPHIQPPPAAPTPLPGTEQPPLQQQAVHPAGGVVQEVPAPAGPVGEEVTTPIPDTSVPAPVKPEVPAPDARETGPLSPEDQLMAAPSPAAAPAPPAAQAPVQQTGAPPAPVQQQPGTEPPSSVQKNQGGSSNIDDLF